MNLEWTRDVDAKERRVLKTFRIICKVIGQPLVQLPAQCALQLEDIFTGLGLACRRLPEEVLPRILLQLLETFPELAGRLQLVGLRTPP